MLPLQHLMQFESTTFAGGNRYGSDFFRWKLFGGNYISWGPYIQSTYPLSAAGPRWESMDIGIFLSFEKKKRR